MRKAKEIRSVPSSSKYQISHRQQLKVKPYPAPFFQKCYQVQKPSSPSLPSFLLPFPFLWQKPVIHTNIFYFRKHHAALKHGDVLSTSGWLFPAPPGRNKKKEKIRSSILEYIRYRHTFSSHLSIFHSPLYAEDKATYNNVSYLALM